MELILITSYVIFFLAFLYFSYKMLYYFIHLRMILYFIITLLALILSFVGVIAEYSSLNCLAFAPVWVYCILISSIFYVSTKHTYFLSGIFLFSFLALFTEFAYYSYFLIKFFLIFYIIYIYIKSNYEIFFVWLSIFLLYTLIIRLVNCEAIFHNVISNVFGSLLLFYASKFKIKLRRFCYGFSGEFNKRRF
jgi:hypothetical protein